MENKRIIFEIAGAMAVVVPSVECGLTIEEIAAKDVPGGVPFEIIAAADLPADRTFRAAWRKNGAAVVEDLDGARLVAHARRRAKRAAELAPMDIEATIPAKAAAAETSRQAIRDKHAALQLRIDAADVAGLRTELAAL